MHGRIINKRKAKSSSTATLNGKKLAGELLTLK